MNKPNDATCRHIIGQAFTINRNEGPAWVRRWQYEDEHQEDATDWTFGFKHCALCGHMNTVFVEDVEVISQ